MSIQTKPLAKWPGEATTPEPKATQYVAASWPVDSIPLSGIKDGGAQMRIEMRLETVDEYAADILDRATFPPIVVFYDGADFCRWISSCRSQEEDWPRHYCRRDQRRLFAGRDPLWCKLQCSAWSAAHPGGQAACRRKVTERP